MKEKAYAIDSPLKLSLTARVLRLLSAGLFLMLCLGAAGGALFWRSLPDVSLWSDPTASATISVRDWQGAEQPFVLGPNNPDWVPFAEVPEALVWAVIVAEDANFYKHHGLDLLAIKEALLYDLQQKSFARGASTITQQLAKNLYLSREKKVSRKLREALIAWRLEAQLGKERILELYLNMVELGPLVHGFEAGARHHLAKSVRDLSAAEAAYLAAILPGPRVAFNPERRPQRVRDRAATLLNFMHLRRVIEEGDYQEQLVLLETLNDPEGVAEAGEAASGLESSCAENHSTPLPEGVLRPWQLPLS